MRSRPAEDDTPLVEACIRQDAEAWEILVKKYSALISASIANRLKRYGFDPSCEDTADIRQNVLSSIWRDGKLEGVRNRKSIAYWIAIVSGNAAIGHMRKKIAEGNAGLVPASDTTEAEAIESERPREKELSETIERSIESLPQGERLVIKLNLLHEMGYREIARMLKMPEGTVSSYIKRAKDKLKKKLKNLQ